MPGYKGHIAGGIVTGLLVHAYLLPASSTTLWCFPEHLLLTVCGALFPDIDTKSKGQKLFYSTLFIYCILLFLQQKYHVIALLSLCAWIPLLVRHRGIFHQPWFLLMLMVIILCIAHSGNSAGLSDQYTNNVLCFFAGAWSHIILDRCIKTKKRR